MTGTQETIYVKSQVPETHYFLDDEEVFPIKDELSIPKKSIRNAVLYARKDGCESVGLELPTSFNQVSLLGLFVDLGLISILVIDWGIYGSIWELDKLSYELTPKCPSFPQDKKKATP
jgi:hypothetical protein